MAKGIKTGGGSRAGILNKGNQELKDMIRAALDDAGGQAYLARQAKENPTAFLSLIGKILPRDNNLNLGGEVKFDRIERLIVPAKEQ
jgi:hypothetical protein